MSHYTTIESQIKDSQCLIESLQELMNLKPEQIEIHEEAQNLYDYTGTMRPQKANIIIRRQYVGLASNDMGFVRQPNGTYDIIVDDFSRSRHQYDQKWVGKLKQLYNSKVTIKTTKKMCKKVTKTILPNRTIKIAIEI